MKEFPERFQRVFDQIHGGFAKFFAWKWHYAITLPAFLLFLYLLFFTLCYQSTPYTLETDGSGNSFYPYGGFNGEGSFRLAIALSILAILGVIVSWLIEAFHYHQWSADKFARGVIVISAVILCFIGGYHVLNGNFWTHDWSYSYSGGHWSVIYDIYTTGKMPDVNLDNQYYQPRFWHVCMVLFMKFNSFFMPAVGDTVLSECSARGFPLYTVTLYSYLESCRILMTFVGILSLFLGYKVMVKLFHGGFRLGLSTFFFAFTPVMWYVVFYSNNDSFAWFFALLALFFALRYREKRSWFSLVMIALAIGCGMETKLNAGLVAIPVALIFFFELLRVYKKENGHFLTDKKTRVLFWVQIAVFALIVFPLGLGGSLYNKLVYGEPIGYVLDLQKNPYTGAARDSWLIINETNPLLRFFLFPTQDCWMQPQYIWNYRGRQDSYQDFNVWTAFLKTTLWGEGTPAFKGLSSFLYFLCEVVYNLAIVLGLLFVIASFYFIIRKCAHRKEGDNFLFFFFLVSGLAAGGSYAYFCAQYPVACSMNARYALLFFIPLYGVLASFFDECRIRIFPALSRWVHEHDRS